MAQLVKNPPRNAGDQGSIPGLGRSPGDGKGYPLQYSGPVNSLDCVHGAPKSRIRLSDFHPMCVCLLPACFSSPSFYLCLLSLLYPVSWVTLKFIWLAHFWNPTLFNSSFSLAVCPLPSSPYNHSIFVFILHFPMGFLFPVPVFL